MILFHYSFPDRAFEYALMVPSWADQLLPQLLMEQFDTLPIQYRHIEDMHEGFWLRKNEKVNKQCSIDTPPPPPHTHNSKEK